MKILYLPDSSSQQRQHEKKHVHIYPIRMAMEATYMRDTGHKVEWDRPDLKKYPQWQKILNQPLGVDFSLLKKPDRIWTKALDPIWQGNGNFKYHPGTYIQSASSCWWGKCEFCVEREKYFIRPVEDVIDEIEECKSLGFREIFDDSGTFPTGKWLDEFCKRFAKFNRAIRFSCNMRLVDLDYYSLNSAGFRMLLFGIESANQETLDRINKGTKIQDVKYVIAASLSGLEPHVSVMFGYPWETDEDAMRTLRLVWWLLRKGYAKTAQASFYTSRNNPSNQEHKKYVPMIYRAARYHDFWLNKLRDIKNKDDLKYFWRMIKEGIKNVLPNRSHSLR